MHASVRFTASSACLCVVLLSGCAGPAATVPSAPPAAPEPSAAPRPSFEKEDNAYYYFLAAQRERRAGRAEDHSR